jgi:hypothetical protein
VDKPGTWNLKLTDQENTNDKKKKALQILENHKNPPLHFLDEMYDGLIGVDL